MQIAHFETALSGAFGLNYRSPEQFESAVGGGADFSRIARAVTMSFLRHEKIYPPEEIDRGSCEISTAAIWAIQKHSICGMWTALRQPRLKHHLPMDKVLERAA